MRAVGWIEAPLSHVAEIERETVSPTGIRPEEVFIGLEHISSTGAVDESLMAGEGNIASAKFRFTDEHILYGKLRPYLKKIALPTRCGVCSTDILPLRPKHGVMDRLYLFYFLRQDKMIDLASSRSTGANLPRLSPSILAEFPIRFPSITEQRRIAAILDKADAIRRKRQQALALADDFLRSAFLEMFGDIKAKKTNFPLKSIRGLVNASSGKSSKEVVSDSETSIPIYGGNGVNGWALCPLYFDPVIVVGRVGQQCGITRLTSGPAWVTDNAIAIEISDPSRLNAEYLEFALQMSPLRFSVQHLDLPFINQGIILDFPLPVPPIEVQRQFATLKETLKKTRDQAKVVLGASETLFASLSQRAFRGDL